MDWHALSTEDVVKARDEVVDKDHVLASAEAREGGRKRLYYNPVTRIYRVKTDKTEATFGLPDSAAHHYTEK